MLAATFALHLLPWSVRRWLRIQPAGAAQSAQFRIERTSPGRAVVHLSGDWRGAADHHALRLALAGLLRTGTGVEFDLSSAPALGSAMFGLMALLDAWQVEPRALRAESVNDRALKADLHAHGAQHLLQVHR
jgi:hypothetical protein